MGEPVSSPGLVLVWVGCALAAGCTVTEAPGAERPRQALGGDSHLVDIFRAASAEVGVPAEILAAVSYRETRLRFVAGEHSHGQPVAIGLMALGATAERSIEQASRASGIAPDALISDEHDNVLGAAALLAEMADGDWRQGLLAYGGQRFADDVAGYLEHGVRGRDARGRDLVISARPDLARQIAGAASNGDGIGSSRLALGYPGAIFSAAHSSNYSASSRGAAQINYVVVHTVQGSYNGAISWFKNSSSNVSAHYVVRSADGEVTQMVDDSDVAWHDACFNSETIGIEHEGYVGEPGVWYTEPMYLASAQLTAWLANQYGIPLDRQHILGHGEAPDCSSHTDPGPGWDWDHYMALVETGGEPVFEAEAVAQDTPTRLFSGEERVVWFELENHSNVTWGLDETRLGTAEPHDRESPFFVDGNWMSPNRATGADHSNYGPGSVGRFTFEIRAPEVSEPTTFVESFQLVQEGVTWFGPVMTMSIEVVPAGWSGEGGDEDETSDPAVAEPAPESLGGGCAAGSITGSGGSSTGCAILLCGVLVFCAGRVRRRRMCWRMHER